MNIRSMAPLALVLVSCAAFAENAVDFDPNTGNAANNGEQTIGWQFNVLNDVTVTHLSWFDKDGDGLDARHEIGIWAPDGTLLVSDIMPAGTAATLDGIWRVIDVPDLVLTAGEGYIVGGYNGQNNDWLASNVDQTVNSNLEFVDATFAQLTGNFERPTEFSVAETGFYGPSFQLMTGSEAVPEPASMLALGAGALALIRRRKA